MARGWVLCRAAALSFSLGALAWAADSLAADAPAGNTASGAAPAPATENEAPIELDDVALGGVVAGSVAPGSVAPGNVAAGNVAAGNVAAGNVANGSVATGGTASPQTPVEIDSAVPGGVSAPHPAPPSVRLNGLVLLHMADGVGAGGQLRFGNLGVRASLAYAPQYYIVDDDPSDNKFARVELTSTAQLNVDTFYLFGASERGMSLSYRYSTLLGHGLGLAYQSHLEIGGQPFALSVPVVYYPAGTSGVEHEFGLHGGERVNFPFGPKIHYGIGVAWLF
jgi:hypothetical protein